MALTRAKILDTAFDLLSQYGLADLSMRRLATELEVAPGALYYHVKNKQELLASLASRLVAGINFESGQDATDRLMHASQELYHTLAPIPEVAEVLRMALVVRPEDLAFYLHSQAYFAELGVKEAELASRCLIHLCISFLEEEQTRALIAGRHIPQETPAQYQVAVQALISGFSGNVLA